MNVEGTDIATICLLLFAHWVADFVTQPNSVAATKWSSAWIVLEHALGYNAMLFCCLWPTLLMGTNFWALFLFVSISGILHFLIDWPESKLTHYFLGKADVHNFFVIIGLGQLLHVALLIITANILL